MRLRALLETGTLGLHLLTGEDGLDRAVRGVMTTDLRDPSRYLSGGELVLTGLAWYRNPEDAEPFVRILAGAGVTGLAAGEAEFGLVPESLVTACAEHRMPLFAVTEDVAFATVTEHVLRQVSTGRAGDLAAVVDRHRRMMSPGPAGGGPDVVLDLLGSDLDLRAWVLSVTGRTVAGAGSEPTSGSGTATGKGTGAGPAGGSGPNPAGNPGAGALPPEVRSRLAGEHLAAVRRGRPWHEGGRPASGPGAPSGQGSPLARRPHRVDAGGTTYSLFPVHEGAEGPALADWFLAVEDDAGDWPEERLDLLHGVTQLIAVERDRRDAARTVRRRLATEVLELLHTGAPPAEIGARLRVAAPVLLPGLGSAPHWQVVVARLDGSPHPDGPGCRSLLEEILLDPRATGVETADRAAVTDTGSEAVALVPLPSLPPDRGASAARGTADSHGAADASSATASRRHGLDAGALLAAVQDPLSAGLTGDERLTLGVSATVHSADRLHGALEEARHARRVAAAREGRVCAAGHEELASHVLLLPFVPDDVRRAFTARLLAPLREYDRRHRAELLPTLSAFLDADGSWTRCADGLHLHVNTLRYRIGRIEQLTGRDLSRLEDKLDFFLALRLS
ncbi:PucR family transcriptional regulator [Streptomyces marispadix]|uniref:PucR family transcriptional regulator ligand-binding domain-containing protein n=1 Tax=Streptomyces marispadix TaxID=2922868 RepID=A0ABS9T429_9ACTN|nr:PucR family transcriptional regulator [Streptomyces marispadix]MCH6163295.1 PucR family transcriptional regulator ligand-binding domain-containing protein [Streptomyces marispadix]